jgi:hypothetical protein
MDIRSKYRSGEDRGVIFAEHDRGTCQRAFAYFGNLPQPNHPSVMSGKASSGRTSCVFLMMDEYHKWHIALSVVGEN